MTEPADRNRRPVGLTEDIVEWSNTRLRALIANISWDKSGVISGLGWDWLAAALVSADEHASQAATGLPAAAADAAANSIRSYIAAHPELAGGYSVFARHAPLRSDWAHNVRPLAQDGIDTWVREHTLGLIDSFPADTETSDLIALSAVAAKTRWQVPFTELPHPDGTVLVRQHAPEAIYIDDTVTAVRVDGTRIDVWLVAGHDPDTNPADVIRAAVAVAAIPKWARGFQMPIPAALNSPDGTYGAATISTIQSRDEHPTASVTTIPFDVESHWDLTDAATGSSVLADPGVQGIWADPAIVTDIEQRARMRFDAEGFEAAAATAATLRAAGRPPARTTTRTVDVTFDRPFAVTCADPDCGIVPFAGWVIPGN